MTAALLKRDGVLSQEHEDSAAGGLILKKDIIIADHNNNGSAYSFRKIAFWKDPNSPP